VLCFFGHDEHRAPRPAKISVNATTPLTSSKPEVPRQAGDRLADLGDQVARKLAEIERSTSDARCASQIGELKALVAQMQGMIESRVEAEVGRRTQELASLSDFLQTNSEREKAALARELHDQLGGILTPAKMDLAWLDSRLGEDPEFRERMARLGKLIDQGIDLKRRIIENLRPSLLDHLGLAPALQWYVDEACHNARIEPHLHISKTLERLPPDLEIALYRLVQEAVTNVVRHSKAAHLDLTIERTPKGVHMTVSDDGVGIDNFDAAKKLSHGLAGMSHRVRSINGTFHVHSLSGQGTRVEMFVPLATRPAAS
jgi:signal transduction histidine kinase